MNIGKINKLSIVKNAYVLPLTRIAQPPSELSIIGRLPEKRLPTVAIVGSRRPTEYGKAVTRQLAQDLARKGVVIVSGLAYGIDTIAHEATLEVKGTTIAVLANGLHRIYPAANTQLARSIVESGGAIVSEKPIGYNAMKHDFLSRNRLVSGLADAVIVTEATERSGTLSTVAHALEQNKEVFAVPGPITSLLSAGPNRLIQTGAHPVLSAKDVLQVIAPELLEENGTQQKLPLGSTDLESSIISCISRGVSDGEALLESCAVEASEFLRALTMLEIQGSIRSLGANKWAIRS